MADELEKLLPPWVADIDWPTTVSEKNRTRVKPERVFKSYVPSSREQMIYALARYYNGGVKGEKGYARANETMGYLDWTPVGLLNDMNEAGRAIGADRKLDAAITAGLAIVPGPGDKLIRNIKRDFNAAKQFVGDSLPSFKQKPTINPVQENLNIRRSDDVGIFDPPNKSQRPIEADYHDGIIQDKDGNLLVDMDGDPLTAKYIAGRRTVEGGDVGLTPEEINAIGEEIIGKKIEIVPADELDGAAGIFRYDPDTKEPVDIRLADDLTPEELERVRGHEVSHAMDLEAGELPTKGLGIEKELDRNYSILSTGEENRRRLNLPHLRGYQGDHIRAEKVAEAFRAALTNPNYLKTVAPKTYETLRKWIKRNPELARIVQLNNLAAAAAAGLSLFGGTEESKANEPPRQRGARTDLNDANSSLGPPPTFEFANDPIKESSLGLAKIAKALELRNLAPTHRAPGKFSPVARALLDLQKRRRTPAFGGPR